ncbi:acyltransferase family protein [Cryptosporangium japonicum]|uniref:Acyltransferase 3 domain-containing protein n=1 Tax=Cryptosporangium japonicum TaxID=80872 RepID=A0ABP3EBX0_9ACTN
MTALAPAKPVVDAPAGRVHVTVSRPIGERNRYFDVLRAACIAYVVLYHMFPLAAFSYWPRMGLLFAIAGSLTARSLDTSTRRAVGRRLRRLLVPLWATAALAVPVMVGLGWRPEARWELLFWVVPFSDPPGADWAGPLTEPLWYLRTYLWLLLLSPVLLPLFRRFPRMTVLVPAAVAVAIGTGLFDVWTLGERLGAVVRDASIYLPCWLLGFAHRDEWIAHARRATVVIGGAVLALAGVVWAFTHPAAGSVDLNLIPLAQLLFSTGTVLLLLRPAPSWAGLERRWWPYLPANWLVMVVNRRAMVIYLWHNVALALSFPIGTALGIWALGTVVGTAACFGIALVLVGLGVVAFGWIEDVSADRRPTLLPRLPAEPPLTWLGGPIRPRPAAVAAGIAAGSRADAETTVPDTVTGDPAEAPPPADPWALGLLRADQFPAEESRPVRVVHAVGIAGGEVRAVPTTLLVREVAWSAFPGQDAPVRSGS